WRQGTRDNDGISHRRAMAPSRPPTPTWGKTGDGSPAAYPISPCSPSSRFAHD
ncbi:MAG: hypothetical protein AVDCRST_MAG70-1663, partial [uncultured Thermomicrobiales bacterium]